MSTKTSVNAQQILLHDNQSLKLKQQLEVLMIIFGTSMYIHITHWFKI